MFGVSYYGLTAASDPAAPPSRAQGHQRAGLARRPMDERRRPPLRRSARELRLRVRRHGAGRQEQEHPLRLRHLRHLPVVSRPRPALEHQRQISPRLHSVLEPTVDHPNYDDFWKKEAWVNQLHASTVPNLNVAGFWDQEDPWGPWQIFRHAARERSRTTPTSSSPAPGTTASGRRRKPTASASSRSAATRPPANSARQIEAPFFRYYLHGEGEKPAWQATTFQSGLEHLAHLRRLAARRKRSRTNLYLHADGTLSFDAAHRRRAGYREYVSDPANPVPYRERPISPTYPGGDWRTWEVADQRFVDHRPDVLTYVSAPLDHDVTVTGPLSATCSPPPPAPTPTSSSS